jgi:predicted metalloendopeptidase
VGQDDKLSTAYIAQFTQGGLGLPDRDYYASQEPKSQEIRVKYLDHVARMFALMGEKPLLARAHAGIVLALETRLAGASMTRVERRDPDAVYHKMTLAELAVLAPASIGPVTARPSGCGRRPSWCASPGSSGSSRPWSRRCPWPSGRPISAGRP